VTLGPTWQRDEAGCFVRPQLSLGWHAAAWAGKWLQHEDGQPWKFTREQFRFLLHWYSIDDDFRFVYRDGVLQRLKGWGRPRQGPPGRCAVRYRVRGAVQGDRRVDN
jgi:hypothetical protein